MKTVLLVISFLLTFISTRAQNNLSVNTMASFGPFGNEVQMGVEYKMNRFSLGMGVAYFSSVYSWDSLNPPYPNSYNYQQTLTFQHIFIPLNFGYHILLGNRFYVVPIATVGFSYNFSAKYMSWSDYYNNLYERKLSSTEFSQNYRQTSIWGGLSLRFSYKVSERFNIFGLLHAKVGLTPINRISGIQERSSSGGLGFGLQYNFNSF